MESRAILLIFFFSSSLCFPPVLSVANGLFSNETDKAALLAFKLHITNDPSGVLRSWNDTIDFCSWEGISCSKKNRGRVISIYLGSLGLTGYISSSLDNLTFLHYLNLRENEFSGTIPPSLFRLPRLQKLHMGFNSLYGEIPSNLSSSLTYLNLTGNSISGTIPSTLGHLQKLRVIALSNTSLTGNIPPSLGNLSSLQVLELYENQLEGNMPEEIGNHPSLVILEVSANNLSGELPASIFNLSSAYAFVVAANNFEGMLSTTFGNNLPNLEVLIMGLNKFEGPIPASLTNASKLSVISLPHNNFSGVIPFDLGRLSDLSDVNFAENQLEASDHSSWRFFDSLTNCSLLEFLEIQENRLSGTLPSTIVNFSITIRYLKSYDSEISGSIPSGIGNLINLELLDLESNLLTGAIPESIGNLTKLQHLHLNINGFEGPIPPSIGNLNSLEVMTFEENQLSGNIPKEIFRLPSIELLSLSLNNIDGPIPPEIGGLKHLRELYIHGNRLIGEIPSSISGCMILEILDLSYNLIQGTIPPSIGDLSHLRKIDLSKNNLTGTIPEVFGKLTPEYLNFSFNHLVGEVPREGIFLNASAASLQGNDALCGGISSFHLLACPHIISSGKRRKSQLPLLAILVSSIVGFSLIFFSVLFFKCRRSNHIKNTSNEKIMTEVYPKVSYADLARATDGFSPANLLGIGHYGSVFKGSLINYGYEFVAVKVFNMQQRGAARSFLAECEAVRQIRHRNLLKILTCCVGIDSNGDDFMAIVFEFMPNGNLDTWLHTENMEHLDLIKRLNIAINIADALSYLHYECEVPIIHCDLKPSNVLLDCDMVAHVADFGLARLLHRAMSDPLNESQHSYPTIKGSIGYAAPEYGLGNTISIMGDVYSYGIILLELFTGRRPTEELFKDGLDLHKFVEMAIPDHINDAIEPFLLPQLNDEAKNEFQSRTIYECLISILQLSLSCSKEIARERISMTDVVVELYLIRDAYLKLSSNVVAQPT